MLNGLIDLATLNEVSDGHARLDGCKVGGILLKVKLLAELLGCCLVAFNDEVVED